MRRINIKKILLTLLTVSTACLTTASCTDKPAESMPEVVTVVLDWIPNTNHTGLYVALEKGYYEEEGLSVKIVEPPEDGALMLLASGKADFGISFQEEIAAAITADEPLEVVAVAALIQHNTSGVISVKEKGITSPKAMEGHNYATWGIPIEQAILRQAVEKDGGDFNKLELIPSTVTDVISALLTDIDTIWVYYTLDGVGAQIKGLDTNFFYFKDIDPVLDFYTPVLAASEAYLNNNGESAKKFLAATAKGYEYAIDNPEEAADILCRAVPELDRDITLASQFYLAGQYKAEEPRWGYIDPARWDAFYGWLNENELVPTPLSPGQGFTNEFLE